MKRQVVSACALMLLGFAVSPVMAQSGDTIVTPTDGPGHDFGAQMLNTEPPVFQNDLDGPRVGLTFMPNGAPRTQFGWHSESQAGSGTRGPWFLVERIWLVGGVEKGEFIPSGTLIFGVRTPGGFEFGVGPSLTLGPEGFTTAIVAAAGQTLRYGGIRVPVNLAVAMSNREGRSAVRVSLITGWAIKQSSRHESRPYKYGLEK
jgi:hypothetical protein